MLSTHRSWYAAALGIMMFGALPAVGAQEKAPVGDEKAAPRVEREGDRVNREGTDRATKDRATKDRAVTTERAASKDRGKLARTDHKTSGMTVRASQIVGMNVYNAANKEIGEVNDLVLDPQSGEVRYAALSFGGFLGLGDKLFAVPWHAFECRQGDEAGEYHLILHVTEEALKQAPGFDQDHWPNFADPTWSQKVNAYYQTRVNKERRE